MFRVDSFFAAVNQGDAVDGLRLKGLKTRGPLSTSFFRTSGGRANVTAQLKSGGLVAAEIRPGEQATFQGKTAYKGSLRPTKVMKLIGRSGYSQAVSDVNKVKVIAR